MRRIGIPRFLPESRLNWKRTQTTWCLKLIEHLKSVKKYRVEEKEEGIYYVYGDLIPIQILITKKLSAEENLWLKSLTNKLNETAAAEKLIENYMDHKESSLHRSMIETIMRANQKLFQEVNGMSDIFMEIVQEKFDRKLKEEVDKAVEAAVEEAVEVAVEEAVAAAVEEATEKAVKETTEKNTAEVTVKTKLTERISLIRKKCARNKSLARIADDLETDTDEIRSLYEVISKNPEKTVEELYQIISGKVQK